MHNNHLTLNMRRLGLALCLVAAACVDGGAPDREPAWILMNVVEMELNGQLYDPEMSPQPSIFRSAHISGSWHRPQTAPPSTSSSGTTPPTGSPAFAFWRTWTPSARRYAALE